MFEQALCHVALHASGYAVSKGVREHERVLESIKFTLDGEWVEEADYFDRCRRRRHQSMYEYSGVARKSDATDLLDSAKRLHDALGTWLSEKHRALLEETS